MAQRIVVADGALCSNCGTAVEARAGLCFSCGQPFEGDVAGTNCPQCGRASAAAEPRCPACGADLPRSDAPPPGSERDGILDKIAALRHEGRAGADRLEEIPSAMPEQTEQTLLADLESVWKRSEPFEQVVLARRKRLEQMDRLVAAARRRVRELEQSLAPAEVREREELKRQVQEVLLERDEILKIEFGITEMERIYRNIITMQQKELRAKEDALKARLEGFRKEIGMRDAERQALADRERDLEARERALQGKLAEAEANRASPEPSPPPAPGADSVTREQWLAAQREIQEALMQLRGRDGEIILPTVEGVRDLRIRVTELEEGLEKATEERNRIEQEIGSLRAAEQEVRAVLQEIDDLLGKLPDDEIKRFARSEAFKRYEQLLARLGV